MRQLPQGYGMVQTAVMQMKISIGAKALYALLASYTGSQEYCWPSIAKLMQDLCVSKPHTLYRYMKELVENKLIVKSKLFADARNNHKYMVMYIEDDHNKVTQGDPKGHVASSQNEHLINNNTINNNNVIITHSVKTQNSHKNTYPEEFEKIWKTYPNKADKNASFNTYKKLLKKESHENIERAVKNYIKKTTREKTEPRFVKHLKTFLGPGGHYLDFITEEKEPAEEKVFCPDCNSQIKASSRFCFTCKRTIEFDRVRRESA